MRISSILALTVAMSSYATLPPTWAHGIDSKSAAWGLGGLMAGSMYSNAQHRRAQERQPVSNRQVLVTPATVVPVTTAAPSTMTAEQKIDQLNKLAAGGYISPAEYKAAKQAVVNSIVQ
jgi:hypothetical protein